MGGGASSEAEQRLSAPAEIRVERMMNTALTSGKPWALRPSDPDKLREMLERTAKKRERAAPANTLAQEESAMRLYWEPWCHTEWGTPAIRPDVKQLTFDEFELECEFWAGALVWIHERMPSKKTGVPGEALPSSALMALRNIRRQHKRQQINTVPLTAAVNACDGLLRDYAELHGPEALIPRRREPLTNEIIQGLLSMEGKVGRRTIEWNGEFWGSLKAMFATLAQTGMRKAEVSLHANVKFNKMHLSMANVRWIVGGVMYDALTPELYAKLQDGDYALLRVPPSKADQFGLHWGASTIYLMYRADAAAFPICAARELAREEMRRAVAPDARREAPLFVSSADMPFRHQEVSHVFHAMLHRLVGADRAAQYSVHSFRIYLACALLEAGASSATIQAMLRWRSDDALKIYARINDYKYSDWLEKAGLATVSSVRTTTGALRAAALAQGETHPGHTEDGAAHAAFQTDLREKVAAVDGDSLAARAEEIPTVDGDARAMSFASAMPALLREAERLDEEGL